MSELCSFECLKLYSLNFAIALAQIKIVMLAELVIINIVLHKKQENWLITWNKLRNQFQIYQICKKWKLSPFDKNK